MKRLTLLLSVFLCANPLTVDAEDTPVKLPSNPTLSCTVRNPLVGAASHAIPVSNLKPIDIEVSLTFPGSSGFQGWNCQSPQGCTGMIPSGFSVPVEELWAAGITNAPGTTKHPTVGIKVIGLSHGTRTQVPVQLTTSGGGNNLDALQSYLSLTIPVDRTQRQEQIRRFLEATASEASKTDTGSQTLHALRADPQRMVEAMDAYLPQQNQVGTYEIRCTYSSHQPGFWNITLESEPVLIAVIDQGDFTDRLALPSQPVSAPIEKKP